MAMASILNRLQFMKRQWTAVLVLWLAWGACFGLGFLGEERRYRYVRKVLVPFQQQVQIYDDLISKTPHVDKDLEDQKKQLQKLKEQNLGRETIPRAIQEIAQIAAATGVTLEPYGVFLKPISN